MGGSLTFNAWLPRSCPCCMMRMGLVSRAESVAGLARSGPLQRLGCRWCSCWMLAPRPTLQMEQIPQGHTPAARPPPQLQWQEAGGWAGSDWAAAAAQRASDGVAALARLHDSYLLCRDPVLSLKLAAGLWGLSVLGSYLRCVHLGACAWSGLLLSRAARSSAGWMQPVVAAVQETPRSAGGLVGCGGLSSLRFSSVRLLCCTHGRPPVHRLTCLQHLEPGGPWLCGGLHHPCPVHQVRGRRGRAEPVYMRAEPVCMGAAE